MPAKLGEAVDPAGTTSHELAANDVQLARFAHSPLAWPMHWPFALQLCPAVQPGGHCPPQAFGPHCLPWQLGTQVHCPFGSQASPSGQVPQLPPQPSGPHALPWQFGTQIHCPSALHVSGCGQVPQSPRQPSAPHCFPAQLGTQRHWPFRHCSCPVQLPQATPFVPQNWFVSPAWQGPLAVSQHPFGQLVASQPHCPSALQVSPSGQVPQLPARPQPSGPHPLPAQFGTQHRFASLHVVASAAQQPPLQQRVAQSWFGLGPSTTAA